jgi:hypothetical protein
MAAALPAAMLAASAANTVSGYASARRNATLAQQQGDYQANAYNQNASIEDREAADAIARGHEAELRSRAGTRGLVGSQRASFAAQGIDIGDGSAQDVVSNDAALGELDALAIRNNARRQAYGYQTQAAVDRNQAAVAQTAGRNQAKAYRDQGVNTLLGGAGDLFNTYQSYGLTMGRRPSVPRAPAGGYNLFRK